MEESGTHADSSHTSRASSAGSTDLLGPQLEIRDDGSRLRVVALDALGGPMTLGRSRSCSIRVKDATVSARHLEFAAPDAGGVVARDLGSRSGCLRNNHPLPTGSWTALKHADELLIGEKTSIRIVDYATELRARVSQLPPPSFDTVAEQRAAAPTSNPDDASSFASFGDGPIPASELNCAPAQNDFGQPTCIEGLEPTARALPFEPRPITHNPNTMRKDYLSNWPWWALLACGGLTWAASAALLF